MQSLAGGLPCRSVAVMRAAAVVVALLSWRSSGVDAVPAEVPTPCPCLNASMQKAEVYGALQKAGSEAVGEVRATAESVATHWFLRKEEERSAAALAPVRKEELDVTLQAVHAEEEREALLSQGMVGAVETAWQRLGVDVNRSSQAWAASQARSQVSRWLAPSIADAAKIQERLEATRDEAANLTEVASAAAEQMSQVARQAETLATDAASPHPKGASHRAASLVKSVERAEREALARTRQSARLSAMAVEAANQANFVARAALRGSMAAEATAARALARAKANAFRLAALKRRAQLAEQRAVTAVEGTS